MSTKAIREKLRQLGSSAGTQEAWTELEAIENACEVLESGAAASKPTRREAQALLSSIAWERIDRRQKGEDK